MGNDLHYDSIYTQGGIYFPFLFCYNFFALLLKNC